ncbi:MAG: glycosyltransferase [Ilumatobacteraceae bacterium]
MADHSPRLNVVLSPFQNAFFAELAEVVVAELEQAAVECRLVTEPDTIAPDERDVFVLLPPHEWVTVEGDAWLQDDRLAARTIGIGAEQPGSPFFERNASIGRRLGVLFDFSARAVDAFRVGGLEARHLPFGYTARWDRFTDDGNLDGPDVLFMGNFKARRLDALARMAPALGRHRSHLVLGDNTAPNTGSSRWFVAGEDKRRLLASTKVLLNIHQAGEPYFEWLRFTEAALAGAVVLTEPSTHCDPYLTGRDFVEAGADELADALDALLADDATRRQVRRHAYESVRANPFAKGVRGLVEAAAELTARPVPAALPARTRRQAFSHANEVAPVAPRRVWTDPPRPVPTEIVVVGDVAVDAPAATPAGPVTVTRVADRATALRTMHASSAAAVGVVDRPGQVTPAGLAALQGLLAGGADAACAMVAEPTAAAPGALHRLTGLWQPVGTSFDPYRTDDGWFLVRPASVDPERGRITATHPAHAPLPVVVATAPPPPVVVVVMATFNPRPELFHRQVQSLRAQSLTDWVCIVTDDASDADRLAAIRRELSGDDRFELLAHDERAGFYRNFERGLAAAAARRPEFVALADQDDLWYPHKLEQAVARLRDTGASMVFTDVALVDDARRLLVPTFFGRRHPTTDDVLDLTMMNAAIGATSMCRADLLARALPFPPQRYRSFHDHWLARCAQLDRGLVFDPTASMEYVQHGGNVQGFIAKRARWGAAKLMLTARTVRPDEDHARALDTEMVRGRLTELHVLADRFDTTPALQRAIDRHESWARADRRGLTRLFAMWAHDQFLRRRPRRENIEIYYTQAWHDIRAGQRGDHDD